MIKTMREPNCESDHYLVKPVVKKKLMNTNNEVQERNWNKANAQDKIKLKEYSALIIH
jgi:two-component SAPR family response regulator